MASKDRERFIYELCTTAVPGFPQGTAQDHESPDFLTPAVAGRSGLRCRSLFKAGPAVNIDVSNC